LASASADKTVKLWSVDTYKEINTLKGHSDHAISVAFSSNSKYLVSGSFDRTVKLWSLESQTEIKTLQWNNSRVWSVSFSPQ
jgi:WD40 repeat protein